MRVTPGIVAGGPREDRDGPRAARSSASRPPTPRARASRRARIRGSTGAACTSTSARRWTIPACSRASCAGSAEFCDEHALEPRLIDVGGGLGIPYGYESAPDARALASAVAAAAQRQFPAARLVIEPGRSVVGPAGITLYRVLTRKTAADGTRWVALDGGMADNVRPALYGARYTVAAAGRLDEKAERPRRRSRAATASRATCSRTTSTCRRVAPGDLVAFAATGAYGQSMASTYNATPRPAAVLVEDGEARLLTRRETIAELLRARPAVLEQPLSGQPITTTATRRGPWAPVTRIFSMSEVALAPVTSVIARGTLAARRRARSPRRASPARGRRPGPRCGCRAAGPWRASDPAP